MKYNTEELIQECLTAIEENNCLFIDDLIACVSFSKQTFYTHGLDEVDAIKDLLVKNRVIRKQGLRKKWYESDNPTTQIALYKLIGTDDEVERLNGTRQKVEHSGGILHDHILEVEFIPSNRKIKTSEELTPEEEVELKRLEDGKK